MARAAAGPEIERLIQLLARLPRMVAAAGQVEGSLRRWVGEGRRRGLSWERIGTSLGMTRQSAWERFSQS